MSAKKRRKPFSTAIQSPIVVGRVDHVNPRYAYLIVGEGGKMKDVYIKAKDLSSAFDRDIVEVIVSGHRRDGKPIGRVVRVVQRHRQRWVGRVVVKDDRIVIVVDQKKIYQDFFVAPSRACSVRHNDKVIFKMLHASSRYAHPSAEIIDVLGKTGDHQVEMHAIMAEFDLPFSFSKEVSEEANQIADAIPVSEIKHRRDFRKITTFTIDPDDAKDFDDALSFRSISPNRYEVGVHIADVAYYVRANTAVDKEAYCRGTSVYLVDRTIPMLPERLSNQLCSLRPHEDKLTFSVVVEIDENAHIYSQWIGPTVIRSSRRYTYDEAQNAIEGKGGEHTDIMMMLHTIAQSFHALRKKNGGIDFETEEVKFHLDEKGRPLGAVVKERKAAHQLIEEFMLLANRVTATYVYQHNNGKKKNAFVYRAHDAPQEEKLRDFKSFAKQFGHNVNIQEEVFPHALNHLLHTVAGTPESYALQQMAIRTMEKAIYTTEAKGHFGLSLPHYTHFTSPIRRYPDIIAHRMLRKYLDNQSIHKKESYQRMCLHCSEREKRAAQSERASIKYKQVELMGTVIGLAYEGIITGFVKGGIFIEVIAFRCEGMASLSHMKDDYYEWQEKKHSVIGRLTKKMYRMGDKVMVKVEHTDLAKRQVDLSIVT